MKLTKAQVRFVRDNPDAARLVSKASASDDTGCWRWAGAANDDGYGYMAFRGRTWKAHRVSYTLFCGEVPDGLLVCHHCDNPWCVNPAHLFLGHRSTNMKDMVRKGRSASLITSRQDHFRSGKAPAGEAASGHRLTEAQAVTILAEASAGVNTGELAARYGVNRTTIQLLLRGKTWRHLSRPPGLPKRVGAYIRNNAGRAALEKP